MNNCLLNAVSFAKNYQKKHYAVSVTCIPESFGAKEKKMNN